MHAHTTYNLQGALFIAVVVAFSFAIDDWLLINDPF